MLRKLLKNLTLGAVVALSIVGVATAARRQPALAGRAENPFDEQFLLVDRTTGGITNTSAHRIPFFIPLPLDTTSLPASRSVSVTVKQPLRPVNTLTFVILVKANRNGTGFSASAVKTNEGFGSFATITAGPISITSGNDFMYAIVELGTDAVITSAQYSP